MNVIEKWVCVGVLVLGIGHRICSNDSTEHLLVMFAYTVYSSFEGMQ